MNIEPVRHKDISFKRQNELWDDFPVNTGGYHIRQGDISVDAMLMLKRECR